MIFQGLYQNLIKGIDCEFEHFNFESSLWIRVILVIFKMLGNIPDESNVSKKEAMTIFLTLRKFSDKWQPYISYGFSLTRVFLYNLRHILRRENPKKTCIRSSKALRPKN